MLFTKKSFIDVLIFSALDGQLFYSLYAVFIIEEAFYKAY